MQDPDSILKSIFGLEQFRPRQREIIHDVLAGRDTLVVMPTGAGKSLCYQLPATALRGLTLIVSPLISLMTDQVRQLRALRIPARMLSSGQSRDEQLAAMAELRDGFRGLFYVAPERFSAPGFLSIITGRKLSLLAIDEAHCISQWGHDFRPEYLRLGEVRKQLGWPLTIALTATATREVRADIVRNLSFKDPAIHVTGFDRPNLRYQSIVFAKAANKDRELIDYLSQQTSGGIVYCSTRKQVEQVAALLEERLHPSTPTEGALGTPRGRTIIAYHAGMDAESRSSAQHAFVEHEDAIVVATNAFGMGINKPNLRFVIHYSVPGSLESYYQEAGRAGRDGLAADCILYFAMADVRTQRYFIDKIGIDKIGEGDGELSVERIESLQRRAGRQLNAMVNYAQWQRCRRRQILEYFGEAKAPENCDCDVCSVRRPLVKSTGRAARTEAEHPPAPQAVLRAEARSSTQGSSARLPHSAKRTSLNGAPTVSNEKRVPFWEKDVTRAAASPAEEQTARAKIESAKKIAGGKVGATHGPAVEARFERLRTLRLDLARERGWRAFRVFHDTTLLEIARVHPRTIDELLEIRGIGKQKAEEFGRELLAELGKE